MPTPWKYSLGSPCKDCPDRHEACWGHCEKYKQWTDKIHKLKQAEKEQKMRDRESFLRSEKCERVYFRTKKGYEQ